MDIVFLLVPLSLVFAFVIGAVFWFSLKSGQFEDLDGPAERVLMDDDRPTAETPRHSHAASKQFDVDQ
jgi:cbb3-type cytochrome oxidase maturation protein